MNSLLGFFYDGGPIFTFTILLVLIVILFFFIKGLVTNGDNKKIIDLMASFAWFAVAWGFLGRTIGLIKAFDMVEAHGELTPSLLVEGFKMALVDPLFGIFVFVIARIGIIILIFLGKKEVK